MKKYSLLVIDSFLCCTWNPRCDLMKRCLGSINDSETSYSLRFFPHQIQQWGNPLPTSVVLELLPFFSNGQPNLHDCLSRKRSSEKSTCKCIFLPALSFGEKHHAPKYRATEIWVAWLMLLSGSSCIATNSSPGDSGWTCKGCNRTQSKPLKSGNWLV
jgi:hypothetical protein